MIIAMLKINCTVITILVVPNHSHVPTSQLNILKLLWNNLNPGAVRFVPFLSSLLSILDLLTRVRLCELLVCGEAILSSAMYNVGRLT